MLRCWCCLKCFISTQGKALKRFGKIFHSFCHKQLINWVGCCFHLSWLFRMLWLEIPNSIWLLWQTCSTPTPAFPPWMQSLRKFWKRHAKRPARNEVSKICVKVKFVITQSSFCLYYEVVPFVVGSCTRVRPGCLKTLISFYVHD